MGWWNSSIRAALYRQDQGDGVVEQQYTLHYIGGTRVMGWRNSCIRAALYKRDQGDGGDGTAVYVLHYVGGTRVTGW